MKELNMCELIRYNIKNIILDKDMMDLFPFNISDEEINRIYTEEKEKYSEYIKLVKMKSGSYALSFSDGRVLELPDYMSINDLKEFYCCISKEAPKSNSIIGEI